MSFNIGSEPDGLEGWAALMLLVTTTQPSSKHSRGAVKCIMILCGFLFFWFFVFCFLCTVSVVVAASCRVQRVAA